MTYLRSLFLNFLVIFFVNRVIPGIDVHTFENVPNIGADLLFSIIVGFLNASIFPFLMIFNLRPTLGKMSIIAIVVNFGAFGMIGLIPFGVEVMSFAGFIIAGVIATLVSIFSNYLELKHVYH